MTPSYAKSTKLVMRIHPRGLEYLPYILHLKTCCAKFTSVSACLLRLKALRLFQHSNMKHGLLRSRYEHQGAEHIAEHSAMLKWFEAVQFLIGAKRPATRLEVMVYCKSCMTEITMIHAAARPVFARRLMTIAVVVINAVLILEACCCDPNIGPRKHHYELLLPNVCRFQLVLSYLNIRIYPRL